MPDIRSRVYPTDDGKLHVENCEGDFVETPIPCGCEDDPGTDPGDYPPPATGGDNEKCDLANFYTAPAYNIMAYFKEKFDEQPNNVFGWQVAAAFTSVQFHIPAVFITTAVPALGDETINASWVATVIPADLSPITLYERMACVFYNALVEGYGVLDYEILRGKFNAEGLQGLGEMVTSMPLAFLNEKAFLYGTGVETSWSQTSIDCDECGDPDPEPVDCDSPCAVTSCNKLIPLPSTGNEFIVSGYASISDFPAPRDACWAGDNFQPLTVDMLANRCVKKIILGSYTPCGADNGNGGRSAHYRIELDDVAVSPFKCSSLGIANYRDCGTVGGFGGAGAIVFEFPTPILARHVKIVPLRKILTIVQVDIILCLD